LARIPNLTPARTAALLALGALCGAILSRSDLLLGLGAVAILLVGAFFFRPRGKRGRRTRREQTSESHHHAAPAQETQAIAAQKRFDTSSRPTQTMRTPILPSSDEPIDWKAFRQRQEAETGGCLTDLLDITRRAIGCSTVALLLPGRDQSVTLRAWSSERDGIRAGTSVQPGSSLLGTLLKPESPSALLEAELPPASRDIGLYDGSIRPASLAAVRIVVQGRPALAMADSDSALTESVITDLVALGGAADLLLERAAALRSELRAREIWQSLGRFERAMGAAAREEAAHEELRQFLLQFGSAEAVFFLYPESFPDTPTRPSERWTAKVEWVLGADCEPAKDFRVDVPGRGVCAGALARGEFLHRRVAPHEIMPFLGHGEPVLPVQDGGDAICLPIQLGVEGRPALLALFTRTENAFNAVHRELLETALSSFGQTLTRLRAGRELEKLATRDGLTGLLNHRTFQSTFRRELLKARRTGSRVALILTDIDFFKKVNDQHGHPAGDTILRHVASVMSSQLRDEVDIVARYGGEEFVCVLVGTTDSGAEETAERIRLAVETSSCDIGEAVPKSVTISLGVSLFPDDANTAEDMIEKADQALYRAKHAGRNRFERALSVASRASREASGA